MAISPPARPVGLALFGAGAWGRNYARDLVHLPQADLRWVCDVAPRARQQVVAPGARITGELDRALDDPRVEAVIVATPIHLHHRHTLRALAAGKHVLVEKPMTTSVARAREMAQRAATGKRTLMVGHLMRHHPTVRCLIDLARAGELGRIRYVGARRTSYGTPGDASESVLWSLGPHDLSMIDQLVRATPVTIAARAAGACPTARDARLEICFADGVVAHVSLAWLDPQPGLGPREGSACERELVVVGTRQTAVFDDTRRGDKLWVRGTRLEQPAEPRWTGPRVGATEPLLAECRHFLHCVATGIAPRSDAAEGLRVVRLLSAAERSLRSGGLPVPLERTSRPAAGHALAV